MSWSSISNSLRLSDAAAKSYVNKGSVGVAVVKEASNRHYQLVAYYSPQSQLAVVDLNAVFVFTLQADGYGTFTASTGHTWSLKFASVEAATDFAQYIALGKCASNGCRELVSQDLLAGSGYQVKEGDIVGISYTAWLVADNKLAKQIDSNAGKVKKVVLGNDRGTIAGWHQAIPGMRKGGVRFVVVPPALAYGQEGARPLVPPNAVLAFRLELQKVKKGAAPLAAAASSTDAEATNRGHIIDRMKNIAVQAWPSPERHDDSAEEASTNVETLAVYQPKEAAVPSAVKEQMEVMRLQMEKMKQDAEVERRVREAEEKAREAERKAKEAEEKARSQQQVVQQHQQPQMIMQPASMYGAPQPYYNQPAPPPQHHHHQVAASQGAKDAVELYVETKEWRRSVDHTVSSILAKVDVVHSRIENSFLGAKSSQEEALSGGNLMKAMRRLIDENDTRGAELADKNERLDSLRATIAQLHEKNEKLLDERNKMLEYRNDAVRETTDASRKQLDGLREEKDRLDKELLTVQDKLSKNKRKYASLVRSHETLKSELDMVKDELIKTKDELQKQTSARTSQAVEMEDLKAQLKKEREARRTIELDRGRLAEQLEEEQESTKRLQASIDARKAGYEEQKERMERLATEEKEALRREIAQLNDTLRQERLSVGSITQEQKQRMEQTEAKHREELARETAAAKEATTRNVESRMTAEMAEAVRAADAKARSEARAAFHADNPLAPEVKELKVRLAGAQDDLQKAAGEHKVTLAKLELAQKAAAAGSAAPSPNGAAMPEAEVSRKIVTQTKAIMSKLYFVVVQSIPGEQTIVGKEAHSRVLGCIKSVTAQVLAPLEGGPASPAASASAPASALPKPVLAANAATSPPPVAATAPLPQPAVVAAPILATPLAVTSASLPLAVEQASSAVAPALDAAVNEVAPAAEAVTSSAGDAEPSAATETNVPHASSVVPEVAAPVEHAAGKVNDWDESDGEPLAEDEGAEPVESATPIPPPVDESVVVEEVADVKPQAESVSAPVAEDTPVVVPVVEIAESESVTAVQSAVAAPAAVEEQVEAASVAPVALAQAEAAPLVVEEGEQLKSAAHSEEMAQKAPEAVVSAPLQEEPAKPTQSFAASAFAADALPKPASSPAINKSFNTSGLWGDDDAAPAPAPASGPAKVAVKQNFSSLFQDDDDDVVVATPEKKTETPKSAAKNSNALFDDDDGGADFLAKPKNNKVDDLFKF